MGFYIQDCYWDAVEKQPIKVQQEVIWALTKLYFTGEESELSATSESLFCMAKDRVLKARTKAEQMRNKRSDKEATNDNTDDSPCLIESERESESESKSKRECVNKPISKRKGTSFKPPTFDEAESYRVEAGLNHTDTTQFLAHYEANGWVQARGKPIKDWKAAMRGWDARQIQWQKEKGGSDADFGEYAGAFDFPKT